jgi:glycosyltransferase involved in cell wall biosynthesis
MEEISRMHIAFDMLIVEYESHEILYFFRLLVDALTTTYHAYTYTIITSRPKEYDRHEKRTNVCIYPVVVSSRQGLLMQHQLLLTQALRRIKPDLLHVHGCIAPVGWQGTYILMAYRQSFFADKRKTTHKFASFHRRLLSESLQQSRFIIALSQEVQQLLVEDWSIEPRIIRSVATCDEKKVLIRVGQVYAEIQAKSGPLSKVAADSEHMPFDTIPSVSVIIPVTRLEKAMQVLNSLCKQVYVGDVEIIVVGTCAQQLGRCFPVHPITLDQQVSPACARNIGARGAGGTFLLFIDDDMIVSENWIAQNVAILQEHRTGTVGVRMPGKQALFFARCADFTNYGYYQHHSTHDQATGGGSMGIARSLFFEVGGFDETLSVGEDIDLCYRVQQREYRTRYCPGIVAIHDHHYLTFRQLLYYNYQHGYHTDLAQKLRYQKGIKSRMLMLVCSLPVFLFFFPLVALVSTLSIIALNIRRNFSVLVYGPFIFAGKCVYEYGILLHMFNGKKEEKV